MHCAPAGHTPRSVSAPMISQSRCCWGTAVSEITGIAHRSGGRVGDGFALFPPVFPRSSALSGYTQFLRWSGWRRKLSLRREFSPALLAAPATLPLRRSSGCARRWIRWEIKTGDPLSSFPIRSSVRCNALCSRRARSEECVRAYESRAPAAAEAPRRVRSRGSHIDLADGLETGSPYFHLYSPGLALSRGGSLSCSSSPLSESALICSSFSPRRFICFVPSGSRVAEATRALWWFSVHLCTSDRVYLSGCLTAFNFE